MFWVIVFIVIIFFVIAAKYFSSSEKESKLPYLKKKYFLTITERKFFEILREALANKYYVFPQINLNNLISVKKGEKDRIKYFNKINRKSIDFVIVEKNYLSPLLAIELDDSSHNLEKRMKRDDFVEKALKDAEIPLLRLKAKQSYNISEIITFINNAILLKENNKQ